VFVSIVTLGVLGILSFTPAKFLAIQVAGSTSDNFVTYRLISERDALVAANERLQKEVANLKAQALQQTGSAFEASVKAQLEELQSVIAAATELDVSDGSPTMVHKGKKGKEQVASALKSSPSKKEGTNRNKSVGGKEVDCEESEECAELIRKQNIALEIGPSFYEPDASPELEGLSPAQRDLKTRVGNLVDGLRALPLGYPADGDVTSHYGFRISPFSRRASFHEGLDISLDRGEDVLATGDGIVTAAKFDGAYGWIVDITHSSNVVSRYAHLSKTLVRIGQSVTRGQRIALSGNSGRSTGPHLHYEVRINGRARNPKAFVMLPQKLAKVL
jgi:murein DD-endopeptidase MepM/ murein hydrolase activator NlpD